MEYINQLIMLSDASIGFYLIDFVMMLGFMAALRILANAISETSISDILAKQDNFAAGISFAGAVIAVAILMMGVVAGDAGRTYVEEVTLMGTYGVAALLFMWLTRKIFDHIALPGVSIQAGILNGNMAAGIVDAGNMIATAIIVRAAMTWVDGSTFLGLALVAVAFVVSQLILLVATLYRNKVFSSRHAGSGKTLQGEIGDGNVALAIRFAGYRLGIGLAVTATSGVVIYDPAMLGWSMLAWSSVAVAMFAAQTLLSIVLRHILLPRINIGEEVGEQRNVAIGSIEAAIYIGIGFTFVGLFV
jgi:uncharacterized membrane protein YjfL (UPF0719 family)